MALTKATLLDLSQQELDSLQDVDLTTVPPVNDNVLKWNGTNWVPGSSGAIATVITSEGDPLASNVLYANNFNQTANTTSFTSLYGYTSTVSFSTFADAKTSAAQSKYGTTSLALDATDDYVSVADSAMTTINTLDFTWEGWIRTPLTNTGNMAIYEMNALGTTGNRPSGLVFYILAGDNLSMFQSGTQFFTSTTLLTANTWQHVAFSRQSNTFRVFIDGVLAGAEVARTFTATSTSHLIGRFCDVTNGNFNGYMNGIRLTLGAARYWANFTPPAIPLYRKLYNFPTTSQAGATATDGEDFLVCLQSGSPGTWQRASLLSI